jgi:hypothetical protein
VPAHPEDDRLLELAYGEAPDAEARALRQHVDGCARCKQFLEGIAEVRTAFRSVPTEPASERGLESLLAYGDQAAARARSRRGGLRILTLLSAAAAFAVVWLVLPSPRRPSEGVARSTVSPPSDALAQAEATRAPAPGDRARDEADDHVKDEKERELKTLKQQPTSFAPLAKAERREEPSKPKGKMKLDSPAGAPVVAEGAARSAPASVGALGNATAAGGKVGAAGASAAPEAHSSEVLAMKKSAGNRADSEKAAASSPPAEMRRTDPRAEQAAKIAAAPLADAVASQDKIVGAVSGGAAGSGSKPAPAMQSMRMGAGSPQKMARLGEIARQLESAKGDQRKPLLMEKCEIEASLQLGPDAVQTCSMVSQEFPGTPEAKRASDLARGFSVQLPATEER